MNPRLFGLVVVAPILQLTMLGYAATTDVKDVALLIVDWEIPAIGMRGTATDVARMGPDGVWKCIVDNPHGGAREVQGLGPQ